MKQKSLIVELAEVIARHWPGRDHVLRRLARAFVPHPGTFIVTLLAVGAVLFAQQAGALPLRAPTLAGDSTTTISYQGRLADSNGDPVNSPGIGMRFCLYDTDVGGSPVDGWCEDHLSVPVEDGLFHVLLGSTDPIPISLLANNSTLWLGITVGADSEMTPREQIASVPYAIIASSVADGAITTEKIVDEAVTQAKLGADVSLEPPDGSITTEKLTDDAVTSSKIAHQFGASNSEMLNFVPRDPTGWDYDDNSQGTYDIDLSSIVSSTAVGVKVLVSYKMGGGRRLWLYPKGKIDDWDKVGWYSWNDAEALSGRQRQFTYDLFFGDYRQLTVYKNGASWGGSEVFKLAVMGWWEPAHQ